MGEVFLFRKMKIYGQAAAGRGNLGVGGRPGSRGRGRGSGGEHPISTPVPATGATGTTLLTTHYTATGIPSGPERSGRVIEIDVRRVPWTGTMSASALGSDTLGSGAGAGARVKGAGARVEGHSPRL